MCSVARGKTCAGQDVDERLVGVEGRLVRVRDLGRRLVLEAGLDEHPVLAAVEPLVAQVAHVGDVLDVEDLDPVVQQGPPDQVGEQVRCAGCRRGRSGRRSGRTCTSGRGRARAARSGGPSGRGCRAGGGSRGRTRLGGRRPSYRAGAGSPGRASGDPPVYSRRCAAGPVPSRCSPPWSSRPPSSSGRRQPPSGPIARSGSSLGEPATLDPAAAGDAGSVGGHRPALRDADDLRRRPPAPAGARRFVARRGRREADRLPPPPGPVVLRRDAAARRATSCAAGSASSTRPTRRRWRR